MNTRGCFYFFFFFFFPVHSEQFWKKFPVRALLGTFFRIYIYIYITISSSLLDLEQTYRSSVE